MVRTLAAARRRVRCAAPAPAASTVHGSGRDDRGGSKARGGATRRHSRGATLTIFVVLGVVLIAVALLFIVPPLARRVVRPSETCDAVNAAVYRDQLRELEADLRAGTLAPDQYEKARLEIEARLIADVGTGEASAETPRGARGAALALGLAIPICALAVYLSVGNPSAVLPQAAGGANPHGMTKAQFEAAVVRLAARMKDNPEDAEGWTMLARSYAVLGRFGEASEAYAKAAARMPRDAQLLADYADALAMAQGRTLQGEPEKIILRALAIDPDNVKALLLAGTAAFNRSDPRAAIRHWERVLGLLPKESDMIQRVQASIVQARSLAGSPGGKAQVAKPAPAQGGNRVSGVVRLAPELAGKVAPGDIVFIFARAAEGPRMPLAILRKRAGDLPAEFTLDDTMAMAPQMKLSAFPRVIIGARVSKSANATASPGDLQGLSAPVNVGAKSVSVVIDTELREPSGK
ncbi:MAG: c-type cytochrome biogenesis protein CcmI [Betaproteobacteria bacterium]|nr:MAG: c-type cytochrome biogenesis protein CcmI [Betaproteobacteria bacterium]